MEELNVPVIISHAELHEQVASLADIRLVMVFMAKEAKVPVPCSNPDCHARWLRRKPEDYRTAISKGIRKINYYSYMSNAGAKAAKEFLMTYWTFF